MAAWYDDPTNRPIPDGSWLMRRFPELALFGSRDAREVAWKIAMRGMGVWVLFAVLLLWIATGILTQLVGRYLVPATWSETWGWVALVVIVLSLMLSGIMACWIRRTRIQRSLREQLIKRGCPICIQCGYDLQGLTAARCPECGTPFDSNLLKHENTGASHDQ